VGRNRRVELNARAEAQYPLLTADQDDGGIFIDLETADAGPARIGHHLPFLAGFKRMVVNDGEAVVRSAGKSF
jgi:hypothetical protein